jgi:hypothetical protein
VKRPVRCVADKIKDRVDHPAPGEDLAVGAAVEFCRGHRALIAQHTHTLGAVHAYRTARPPVGFAYLLRGCVPAMEGCRLQGMVACETSVPAGRGPT